jgi:tRNA(His) 5'-end guanylyltransferase
MKYLCENIQGCVFGYSQSDEISLVLIDYKKLTSEAWFDYEVEKMCSIAASMATMVFNKAFNENYINYIAETEWDFTDEKSMMDYKNIVTAYQRASERGAMFDCRAFNLPKEEVTNCIYWRQLDATRNSIQMVGQANFSHKEMQNKSCSEIQGMLVLQKGINWNDFPTYQKRGSCCIKTPIENLSVEFIERQPFGEPQRRKYNITTHSRWVIDKDIPIFKGEGRKYIDKLIYIGE